MQVLVHMPQAIQLLHHGISFVEQQQTFSWQQQRFVCTAVQDTWRNNKYSMQMLVHTSQAIQRCWTAADEFFGNIKDWSVQPIDVRRPFGFYYGHMASFAKLKLLPNVSIWLVVNVHPLLSSFALQLCCGALFSSFS